MKLMFMLHTTVHIPESAITLITGKSSQQAMSTIIVSYSLVVLLELPVTQKTVVHRHLLCRAESDQPTAVHVVRVKVSLLQLNYTTISRTCTRCTRLFGLSFNQTSFPFQPFLTDLFWSVNWQHLLILLGQL